MEAEKRGITATYLLKRLLHSGLLLSMCVCVDILFISQTLPARWSGRRSEVTDYETTGINILIVAIVVRYTPWSFIASWGSAVAPFARVNFHRFFPTRKKFFPRSRLEQKKRMARF